MRFQMFAVATVLVSLLQTASAQEVELRNDAFESGDYAMAHGGFLTGDMGAVCLVPDGSGPFTITRLQFLFGSLSPSDPQTITLRIYDNPDCAVAPGSEIFACEAMIIQYQSAEPFERAFDEGTGLLLWPMD